MPTRPPLRYATRMQRCAAVIMLLAMWMALACQPPRPHLEAHSRRAQLHDLNADEKYGGHTLQRHVGRTDQQLRERLQQEPVISAASTYTDLATAERVIAAALEQNDSTIQRWIARGPHRPNLVIDYTNPQSPIGSTLGRGAASPVPCDHAIIVLRADQDSYYVLTSYPECRS